MRLLKILYYPSPMLRKVSASVASDDVPKLADYIRELSKAMTAFDGVAIAAPQTGQALRIIVVNMQREEGRLPLPLAMINPEILEMSGDPVVEPEGCLSFPGVLVPVARSPRAAVKFLGQDGMLVERMECAGLVARAVQHEVEHLDGILLIDHVKSRMRRDMIERKMKRVTKHGGPRPRQVQQ